MPEIENSAVSSHGETTVTVDVWEEGAVSLMVENYVATVILALSSLASFSEFATFIRTANSSELRFREVKGATGVLVTCSRQVSRVIFSIMGDSGLGVQSHHIEIQLYGPRLTEFLDCLSEVHEELTTSEDPAPEDLDPGTRHA